MAVDYKTLYTSASKYIGTGACSDYEALKLALLEQVALTQNPMAATDINSLLSTASSSGYSGASHASIPQLLELALLNIIATSGGGGGGGGLTAGNYAGAAPTFTPSGGTGIAVDTSNGRIWWYFNGAWN
jgi:hypothetical protein